MLTKPEIQELKERLVGYPSYDDEQSEVESLREEVRDIKRTLDGMLDLIMEHFAQCDHERSAQEGHRRCPFCGSAVSTKWSHW